MPAEIEYRVSKAESAGPVAERGRLSPAGHNTRGVAAEARCAADLELEWRRKRTHVLPGLLPFVMCFVYHEDPVPLWNVGVVAAVVATLVVIAVKSSHRIRLEKGENWLRTCVTYAIPPVLSLVLFPRNAEYAAVMLVVLAFGDAAAAIGGRRFGRRTLPWNSAKTWAGLAAFLFLAAPLGSLAFWAEARPAVTFSQALISGCAAAAAAGIAESLPSRVNDNLRIVGAALAGVAVAGTIAVGSS